ncbi:acyl carrier protein [Streptomyces sp. NPDC056161]|uniref:acyl carrier protein n=1 Tax=Streptomyces sp. NPDC056161 TaxID=3345732 RepID=UPI0035D5670E
MSAIYEQLLTVLTTRLGIAREETSPEATFEDLEIDSLALVELIDILDAEFGTSLEEGTVNKNSSLAEVASILEAHGENHR